MFFLELLWAEPAKRGVNPGPVVEALYVLEYLERRFLSAGEGARVHAFRPDDPIRDSVTALSHGLETDPMDGTIPFSSMVLPISSDTYWLPWMPL